MKTRNALFVVNSVWLFVLITCSRPTAAQTISSFSPSSGPVGTSVTITGTGFDASPENNLVYFGAAIAPVISASTTSLVVTVPSGANYQYITITNLSNHLTAYSVKPFVVTTSCSSTSSFASAVSVQGGSHNIEICDMDGDGKPDLIIPDYFNNYFTVTRNTSTPGTISFEAKVTFSWAAGGQPVEVALGDLDGDGKPDVVLGGNGGGSIISVYRNTSTAGSISFAVRQDFTASSGQGHGIRIADIDGDGKPDMLSVHWSGNCLWALRNTSTGPGVISFAPGVSFGTTAQPHKMEVGDLDGDGKPDVIITAFTSNTLSIFRNTSTAGSISFAARQDFSPGLVPYFVHVGDLDGDALADIAVVNRDVATLAAYRNTSTSGTITMATKQDFATPAGTMTHYGVAFGDIDGDAKPDIAVGNYTLNKVSVFRNTSVSGTISFAARVDLTSGVAYDVGIDDFDGDGRPDIATTNSSTTVSILRNICTILPIELLSFSVEGTNNRVLLKWSTASELNNDYFSIERSSDGTEFETIAEVKGAGNSSTLQYYSITDEHPNRGMNYYRLRQTDFDGSFSFSEVEAVDFMREGTSIAVYPNPFTEVLIITGTSENGLVVLYDVTGKEILREKTTGGQTAITTTKLGRGMYWLSCSAENRSERVKVIKW